MLPTEIFKAARLVKRPNAVWGLDRLDQRALPLDGEYTFEACDSVGVDTFGTDVYVFDTGLRCTHDEFRPAAGQPPRCVAGWDAYAPGAGSAEGVPCDQVPQGTPCAVDVDGHGTHCAGTAAGNAFGVDKCSRVIAVKVLDDSGSGSFAKLIAGIEWVVTQRQPGGISEGRNAVMSMSLSGNGIISAVDEAISGAKAAGVLTVSSAGNNDADACTRTPARSADSVAVGATTDNDARASYSNYGSCVAIFAPGSGIKSGCASSDSCSSTLSGTSMAAPHVAGALAAHLRRSGELVTTRQQAEAVRAAALDAASGGALITPGAVLSSQSANNNLLYTAQSAGTIPPTEAPTEGPSEAPTATPTSPPTSSPTDLPTASSAPTAAPTDAPTSSPTTTESLSSCISRCGGQAPAGCWCDDQCASFGDCCEDRVAACINTAAPTAAPTTAPVTFTAAPTSAPVTPTAVPTSAPATPTAVPIAAPTSQPPIETPAPQGAPTAAPSLAPPVETPWPTSAPTSAPQAQLPGSCRGGLCDSPELNGVCFCDPGCQTFQDCCPDYEEYCAEPPTLAPTPTPTVAPTAATPTQQPTRAPTAATPTQQPTVALTPTPSAPPTTSSAPGPTPTPVDDPLGESPSAAPSILPTEPPVILSPTSSPASSPTSSPTSRPTSSPPTSSPTSRPTSSPTASPTSRPTSRPTSASPTVAPTDEPLAPSICTGWCGSQSPQGCWCDSQCSAFNDCCDGFSAACAGAPTTAPIAQPTNAPQPGQQGGGLSCQGACGGASPSSEGFCDLPCLEFFDCCADACDACGLCAATSGDFALAVNPVDD